MHIPNEVTKIINTLYDNGFEAFIVGGCTRDLLLNKVPTDWDITTLAMPNVVISLFDKTIPTGLKHGTVTVVLNNKSFEVTTYRCKEIYTNHRSPDSVSFTTSLEKDLERRDFTINAIAYNKRTGIIDLFNGSYDIKNKIIRCIGNSDDRFREDALRMLRAIRFSCTLGFSIEENTFCAICKNSQLVDKISGERIYAEFSKMIMGKYAYRFILLYKTKILQNLCPFMYDIDEIFLKDILQKINSAPHDLELRLSILICCIVHKLQSNQHLEKIFNRLRFNKKLQNLITTLYNYYDYTISDKLDIKVLLNKLHEKTFLKWLEFCKFVNPNNDYNKIQSMYISIKENHEPIFILDLKINGNDLKNIGIPEKFIGTTLNRILKHCHKYPEHNKKELLIDLANDF